MTNRQDRKTQWRSLAELAGTAQFRAFMEAEFPAAADPSGLSRRRWLQLMGASLALAGMSGCRWEKREILPFAVRPGNRVPGVPEHFATAMDLGGVAQGLLVTAVDGRPIKIEGNPHHPQNRGATDAIAQAAVLQLYDPDRNVPVLETTPQGPVTRTWDQFAHFAQEHFAALRKDQGRGLAVLSEASSSPTLAAMQARLLKAFPAARWYEYEAVSADKQRAGAKLAFGKPYRTQLTLEKAQVIVCLDADLLGSHPAAVQYTRSFADCRQVVDGQMNRLYAVESGYSLTGAAADHRLALRSGQIAAFANALEHAVRGELAADHGKPSPLTPLSKGEERDRVERFVQAVANDLSHHRGQGVVAVGPQQPPEVHAAAHRLNALLDNIGKTVAYTLDPQPERPSHVEAIKALAGNIAANQVSTLVILGGNPVYDGPADLGFDECLAKVPTRIRLGLYRDETSQRCTWHLPQAHWLESWGDARAFDGTYSIVQPLIEPLGEGRSAIELLALLLGDGKPKAQALVRETFDKIAGSHDDSRWAHALSEGLLPDSRWPVETPALIDKNPPPPTPLPRKNCEGNELEIVFTADPAVYDGRFANNGWLQELPRPLTKLTWDNAAIFSPATAKKLGVADQTLVKLRYDGRELEMPAFILPGQADGSVAVSLGFGRTAAGHVAGSSADAVEPVGANVYRLRAASAMDFSGGLTVIPTGKSYLLAVTQDHFAIDTVGNNTRTERAPTLAREAPLEHYRQHPDFAKEGEHASVPALWAQPGYEGHRWGMAIDLSRCTGCNACVVACQAENNVPVVGKPQVLKGREMQWIRIDRYFQGSPDAPSVLHQPVACQQCETAPCEQVCPVAATVHSKEGLNDMVYNRCVGTRYCANNCPYKVRRFNFFNYHKDLEEPGNEVLKMVYNPEVTVRCRGVMEKCTYCVQRIQAVKIHAKNDQRTIADGEIVTACQQACPARAIVFGDLSDPHSQVRQAHDASRSYALLGDLNTRPRTAYLARIRNPNPQLVDEHEHDRPST